MNHYILRYGEIALKGKNRRVFEIILKNNILNYVKNRYDENAKMFVIRGRFVLTSESEVDLRPIFGLTSYSKAVKVEKDINLISQKAIEEFAKIDSPETFKVVTHRLNKSFPIKSPEINRIVGEQIYNKFNIPAKMKNPHTILGVEIHNNIAFIYTKTVKCFGGLPLGSSDKVLVPLTNNRSVLTALNLMRRGCKIIFVGDKKDIPIIKLFNNYQKLNFIKDKNDSEILAYASPDNFNNLNKDKDFLMLYPIALFSDKEVDEELKKYEI